MANAHFHPAKFTYWWDAIIDLMVSRPELAKKDIAAILGCTPQYIYIVTSSDMFRARFSQRRNELNENVNGRIVGRLSSVADRALELIAKQLEEKQTSVPLPTLVDITTKTLDKLGYGVRPTNGVNVNVNSQKGGATSVTVSIEDLNDARAALAASERAKLIEHRSDAPLTSGVVGGATVSEADTRPVEPELEVELALEGCHDPSSY